MRFGTALLMLAFAGPALADIETIPTEEEAFLNVIGSVDQAKLAELLGDPAEAIVVRNQENGEELGTIVHYRYLNTNSDGDYYKTTELDYIDGRLVTVVFSNNDFQETAAALPQAEEECPVTC
jgi:hypothetical protein